MGYDYRYNILYPFHQMKNHQSTLNASNKQQSKDLCSLFSPALFAFVLSTSAAAVAR
jgi:hypothetical protein